MKRLADVFISERFVIAVILLNTFAMIMMGYTDPELMEVQGEVPSELQRQLYRAAFWTDYGCVIYFLLEMVLKLQRTAEGGEVFGFAGYWANGWNRFDFVIVLLSTPVLITPWVDLRALGFLLALRIGRLFRLFRMMRFIPNRQHLWAGTKRALRASVGVFLALFLVNLVLSIGATQLFGKVAPEFFGDPALSSYTLFKVFTVEGWYEIPDQVAAQATHPAIGTLARIYFMLSVLAGGILGLSLANAVFVDEITMDNNDDLEKKVDTLTEELRALRAELLARQDR